MIGIAVPFSKYNSHNQTFSMSSYISHHFSAKAQYEAAISKLERRAPDLVGAILQIKHSAERGYVPAKIKLAWSYIFGEGVELDVDKARKIFEELLEKGNAEAHAVSDLYW